MINLWNKIKGLFNKLKVWHVVLVFLVVNIAAALMVNYGSRSFVVIGTLLFFSVGAIILALTGIAIYKALTKKK